MNETTKDNERWGEEHSLYLNLKYNKNNYIIFIFNILKHNLIFYIHIHSL